MDKINITIIKENRDTLKQFINMCAKDDLRPAMCGMNLVIKDGYAEVCASDGSILGVLKLWGSYNKAIHINVVIPIAAIKSTCKAKVSDIAELEIDPETGVCTVFINLKEAGKFKLIDGRYPNYNSVIPKNQPYKQEFTNENISKIISNTNCMKSSRNISNMTTLNFDGNMLHTASYNSDDVFVLNTCDCINNGNKDSYKVHGFDSLRLNTVLKNFEKSDAGLYMTYESNSRAYLFKQHNSENITILLMPRVLEPNKTSRLLDANKAISTLSW